MRHAHRVFVLAMSLAMAAGMILAGPAADAEAATFAAFYPTQSFDDRGADVRALQHLLRFHGINQEVNGNFGAHTVEAVKTFQRRNKLTPDGIVGPATWAKLTPTLRHGMRNEAVRALQLELDAKFGASIAVQGHFDDHTLAVLKRFQGHMGLAETGIVDETTWRNLMWHYDHISFASGGLCDYGNPAANWGTASGVAFIEYAGRLNVARGDGKIAVGDMALEHGGHFDDHVSHHVGLDVDIHPIRKDRVCSGAQVTWQSSTYDRNATRRLIKALHDAAPRHVKLILFNDPVLIREGLTIFTANHDNHLHVRYCEAAHPDSSYVC